MRFYSAMRGVLRDPDPGQGGGGTPPTPPPPAVDYGEIGKIVAAQIADAMKGFSPAPTPAPAPKPGDPPPDPKFLELQKNHTNLQRDLETMRKRTEETERRADDKERQAQIGTVMNDYQFASTAAAADARSLFFGQVSRVKDGDALVGPDGTTPFDKYIRDSLDGEKSFFLAPKNVGGANAGNPGGRPGGKGVDIDEIKPGMSPETSAAAAAQIRALCGR